MNHIEPLTLPMTFEEYLRKKYENLLVESVKEIRCEGYFDYKEENGYAFVNVSNEFPIMPIKILRNEGFSIRYLIRKRRYPGMYFWSGTVFVNR